MAWLERHPRWILHFTPTSGSGLNAVENFFSILTRQRLKRGVFHSVVDLQTAIKRYIDEHNDDPKPLTWTKSPKTIIGKLKPMNASVHSRSGPRHQELKRYPFGIDYASTNTAAFRFLELPQIR